MKKKAATIKISGVRVNPLAWLESEPQLQEVPQHEEQTGQNEPLALFQHKEQQQLDGEPVSLDLQAAVPARDHKEEQVAENTEPAPLDPRLGETTSDSVTAEHNQTQLQSDRLDEPREALDSRNTRESASEDTEEALLEDDDVEQPTPSSILSPTYPSSDSVAPSADHFNDERSHANSDPTTAPHETGDIDLDSKVSACPMHAHTIAPGGPCECMRGYERSELTGTCELLPESAELSRPQIPFALEASA